MSEEIQTLIAEKAHIEIAEKNMHAYLVFEENGNEKHQMPARDINKLLDDAKIKYGIKHDEIFAISEGQKEGSRFLIAEGMFPLPGIDAQFEFYFETGNSFKPKVLDDGKIDYREVNLVKSVAKDAVLVKKIPPIPAVKGMNILGFGQTAAPGKNYEISISQGAYRDPKDPNIIKSSCDGIIFYDEKRRALEVQKLYVVQKSVDYSTGNINVKSSVEIRGDVKPYFIVTSPYNVQVHGLIDNATVTCDGMLSVTGGIVGEGKQVIKVGGDLHSAYINSHRIRCCGSVYVNTEIRNSLVDCDNEVVMAKEDGVIIGGKVSAANKITAGSLGNSYSVRTEIEAGVKLEFKDKFRQLEEEINSMQKKVEDLKTEIADAEDKISNNADKKRLDDLNERLKECIGLLDKLLREFKDVESNYYNVPDPVVTALNKVYPGVVIKIKNAAFEVTEELARVKFTLVNGAVSCTRI